MVTDRHETDAQKAEQAAANAVGADGDTQMQLDQGKFRPSQHIKLQDDLNILTLSNI